MNFHSVQRASKCLRLALIVSLLLFCACSTRVAVTPGVIPSPTYPEAQAKAQARAMVNSFAQEFGYTKANSPAMQNRTEKAAKRILVAAGYNSNDFPIEVLDAREEVNAMVLDGSSIVVFKQLLNRVNDEELAAVLAHEVGHLLGKHSAEQQEEKSRAETVSMASSILGSIASVATSAAGFGGISGTVGSVTESTTGLIGYGAYVGAFSRSQEYEADHIGLMLLAKAGYDPEAAIRLWSREDEVFGSSSSSTGAFFSTHPAGTDRIEKLKEYLPLAKSYKSK